MFKRASKMIVLAESRWRVFGQMNAKADTFTSASQMMVFERSALERQTCAVPDSFGGTRVGFRIAVVEHVLELFIGQYIDTELAVIWMINETPSVDGMKVDRMERPDTNILRAVIMCNERVIFPFALDEAGPQSAKQPAAKGIS